MSILHKIILTTFLGASAIAFPPAVAPPVTRDPAQQPFATSSIWNTPLGLGATFQSDSDPETAMLHNENTGGAGASYAWIDSGSIGIYRAVAGDPDAVWSFDTRSATAPWPEGGPIQNGVISFPTPGNVSFGGPDLYSIVILPDGKTAYEVWKGTATNDGYHTRYIVRTDLTGPGIASDNHRSEGIRAAGMSLLGGLIRCTELANGDIPHGIAMVLSPAQMRAGSTVDSQMVWPASTTDLNGQNAYAGLVPMGALIAIPPSVRLEELGLSPEGLALGRAFQQFGGYVVDTSGRTMSIATTERGCPATAIAHLQQDKRTILKRLALVTNSSAAQPGGPGDRIVPPPPQLSGEIDGTAPDPGNPQW
jgi:hypothetical protein